MVMNISCKFEKASYNIFFVRAVTVKSLYILRRCNKAKSIESSGCYPVDTINQLARPQSKYNCKKSIHGLVHLIHIHELICEICF